MTQAAELPLVTVTWRPICPAELPPGDGSTTALAVVIVHLLPAAVPPLVGLPVLVAELDELDEPEEGDVEELEELELGGGVGVGDELHAARAVVRPAAARVRHTERTEVRPCVVTPPR
jgi:hypothetical protein